MYLMTCGFSRKTEKGIFKSSRKASIGDSVPGDRDNTHRPNHQKVRQLAKYTNIHAN